MALGLLAWLTALGITGASGFLLTWDKRPPGLAVLMGVVTVALITVMRSRTAATYLRAMNGSWIVGLLTFRLGVEISFYSLYKFGVFPKVLTIEGRNFDILVGLTAPLVAYLVYKKRRLSPRMVAAWHFVSLLILGNIVGHAILATPTFGLVSPEMPNIVLGYFPFCWVPGFIVPLAMVLHLASLNMIAPLDQGRSGT